MRKDQGVQEKVDRSIKAEPDAAGRRGHAEGRDRRDASHLGHAEALVHVQAGQPLEARGQFG